MKPSRLETEATEQSLPPARTRGEQTLVPGVRPVTVRDWLRLLADAPPTARKPQKPLNVGLFDEDARNQFDLFVHAKRAGKPDCSADRPATDGLRCNSASNQTKEKTHET